MSLDRRVAALQRRLSPRGPCPRCGGAGWHATVLDDGRGPPPPPRGCPVCGRVAEVTRIVLERGGERGGERGQGRGEGPGETRPAAADAEVAP